MRARILLDFMSKIEQEPTYREARRDFHENYEWIEGYWKQHPNVGDFEHFCDCFDDYYWSIDELRELAWKLASQGCVGNSKEDYVPTQEVIKATMYLLHRAGIRDGQKVPECSDMDCHKTRHNLELCDAEQQAEKWNRSAFKAMMYIVRQIRHNLFHGRKLELRHRQYERNKCLVMTAEKITSLLLEHLVEAEQQCACEQDPAPPLSL